MTRKQQPEKATPRAAPVGGFRGYLRASRDPLNAVILVLPLFVAYQIGILGTGGVRNGVDFMTDLLMAGVALALGLFVGEVSSGLVLVGYVVLNMAVLGGLLLAVYLLRDRGAFRPKLWPVILLESTLYAVLLGPIVRLLMQSVGIEQLAVVVEAATASAGGGVALAQGAKDFTPFVALIQSIGAGLYEEIVFRAGLLGGTYALLVRWGRINTMAAALIAICVSSVIFSAVHHIGPLGDPFTFGVFAFRFFAGVVFCAIFALRGFAVAVYTHAIYDVIVMVLLTR